MKNLENIKKNSEKKPNLNGAEQLPTIKKYQKKTKQELTLIKPRLK